MSNDKMVRPAFPVVARSEVYSTGMALWDYYAAAALSGIVQSSPAFSVEMAAESAGWYADAMLAERAKRQENTNE